MAKKEFRYKGKAMEELKSMSVDEFMKIVPSRIRRSLKRGIPEQHKKVLEKVRKGKKNIKTHCRDMVVFPEMVGHVIKIHTGKEFMPITIQEGMIGHMLGELAMTRKRIAHSSPGVGATKSSASMSLK